MAWLSSLVMRYLLSVDGINFAKKFVSDPLARLEVRLPVVEMTCRKRFCGQVVSIRPREMRLKVPVAGGFCRRSSFAPRI